MSFGAKEDRPRKRRKVDDNPVSDSPPITTSRQLHVLLQSSPNATTEDVKSGWYFSKENLSFTLTISGIDRFSQFLSSIPQNSDTSDQPGQLKLLKEYCDEQSSTSHDQVDFPDLLSSWSHASQANTEFVLSAVPAALTQFFRTVATHLKFREFRLSLCHSLLKREQLRLFDRCLSSPRAKEHLITPCLQLLTEVASLDGGALASNVFNRRDFLYRRLDGILAQTSSNPTRNQTVTAHQAALDFLMTNLRYLDTALKSELISHGRLIYSAIRSLLHMGSETVAKFLSSLENTILGDDNLGKPMKIRCFNSGVLSLLAKLYDYQESEEAGLSSKVRDALHHLLLQVCTLNNGVVLFQSGWYPVGTKPDIVDQDDDMINLGLDSPFHFDEYIESVPVKNSAISTFLQTLKPEADVLQANLITAVFEMVPELVANYFTKKQKFLVSPGDDPKWLGQFAFLFSVVQLPVPQNCGWQDKLPLAPPPLSIVVESIFPRPLDRATIGKCLRMNEDIMTISATRILTVALQKLKAVLKLFGKASAKSGLWQQASSTLMTLMSNRIPPLHDLVTALQKVDRENEQMRTTILECIATYLTVLPASAAATKFDFGPVLTKALATLDNEKTDSDVKTIVFDEIQSLIRILDISLTTKWFHKAATDECSLILQLIRFCVSDIEALVSKQSVYVIRTVLCGKGMISDTSLAVEALLWSIRSTKKWEAELRTLQFVDNCLIRTMQRPVKYLDQLEQVQQLLSDSTDLSLTVCCVTEQWQFVVQKEEKKSSLKNIAEWIARFFSALDVVGENYRVMSQFKDDMSQQCSKNDEAKTALGKAFEKLRKKPASMQDLQLHQSEVPDDEAQAEDPSAFSAVEAPALDLATIFPIPTSIPKSLIGPDRWNLPDFESEIHSGRLASLIRCFLSPESEIRLQAFHTLQSVMHAVDQSTYEEKTQLHLLLGELCETVKAHNLSTSSTTLTLPPSIVAELAIHFLPIVSDPSSPFYRKTNTFLMRGPSWSIPHILPYWIKETFLTEPEVDDADIPFHVPQGGGNHNAQALEIDQLLDLMLRSLRTEEDMNLFRRAQVFTRLFSYYLAPIAPKHLCKKILGVVYQATSVKGGSDTLITRTGVREWLAIAKTVKGHSGHGAMFGKTDEEVQTWIEGVETQIARTCDGAAIRQWEEQRRITREEKGEHRMEIDDKVDGVDEGAAQEQAEESTSSGSDSDSGSDEDEESGEDEDSESD